ncbi:hypothetical protein OIU79_018840 [Salix purpurea]|uniref:Uncharacterized protein n=1 Tax=Salix purpurea TaxID=77065 RepID=A0A9Q0NZS8_SALPP|nr:hypothetical protein OIU79_018840 [Salix purpurea]
MLNRWMLTLPVLGNPPQASKPNLQLNFFNFTCIIYLNPHDAKPIN